MTEKPQVDFEEVVKSSGMPVTEEAVRARFNAIATRGRANHKHVAYVSVLETHYRDCDRACDVA